MEITRCAWCEKDDLYQKLPWSKMGKPIYDENNFWISDFRVFQAGLKLVYHFAKRELQATDILIIKKLHNILGRKVEELIQNAGIIRDRLKILATINNAQKFMEVQKEFGSFQ